MNWETFRDTLVQEVLSSKRHWWLPRTLKMLVFGVPAKQAVVRLRLAHLAMHYGRSRIAGYLLVGLARRFGVYAGYRNRIGRGLRLPHPTGVVIGDGIDIGRNCKLYQQVTVGAPPSGWPHGKPFCRVGDNVMIFPGARIVEHGSVGDNVIIGANAVVNQAFPDNVVVAGMPAKIVQYRDATVKAPRTEAIPFPSKRVGNASG